MWSKPFAFAASRAARAAGEGVADKLSDVLDLDADDRRIFNRFVSGACGVAAGAAVSYAMLDPAGGAATVADNTLYAVADVDLFDIDHTEAGTHTGVGTGSSNDLKFGSSDIPDCWWCHGSGTSTWPSSGYVDICPHCNGSGH